MIKTKHKLLASFCFENNTWNHQIIMVVNAKYDDGSIMPRILYLFCCCWFFTNTFGVFTKFDEIRFC